MQFKKTLTDPDKMEAARQAFLENDEWQNTFDDPDLKAMASGACVRGWSELWVYGRMQVMASRERLPLRPDLTTLTQTPFPYHHLRPGQVA